ncbi:MAG: hypothetical protein ACXABD_08185 [Candidatus Thorarchaeota archaeon]|jgi:hypothetical protein
MAAKEGQTITISEYFEQIRGSVSKDFLQNGLARAAQGITSQQLKEHGIDACVVTYLDNDLMCVNPVSWGHTEYYISDVFTKDDIRFKVFVGESD